MRRFFLSFCLLLASCATSASPQDAQMADALCTQGKALLISGKNSEARDIYASAVHRDADNPRAWNGLGVANDLLGKRADAQEAYQHAVDLAPDDIVFTNNLAHSYLETGKPEEALRLLQPYADDPKAPASVQQNLTVARRATQDKQAATSEVYADLGFYPTEGMAQGHIDEVKKLLGSRAKSLSFAILPEVKVLGGTPVFTVKVTGDSPQSICNFLNAAAFPCVPQGK